MLGSELQVVYEPQGTMRHENPPRHCYSTGPDHRGGDTLIMCGQISVKHDAYNLIILLEKEMQLDFSISALYSSLQRPWAHIHAPECVEGKPGCIHIVPGCHCLLWDNVAAANI